MTLLRQRCWACGVVFGVPQQAGVPAPLFQCGWCCAANAPAPPGSSAGTPGPGAPCLQLEQPRRCPRPVAPLAAGRTLVAVVLLLMGSLFVIAVGALLPPLVSAGSFKFLHAPLAVVLTFNVVFNYLACVLRPAGPVPAHLASVAVDAHGHVRRGALANARYCERCAYYKPPAAHHCRSCGACVMELDHHCWYINNCAGAGNMRHFLLCLLWLVAGAAYGAAIGAALGWQRRTAVVAHTRWVLQRLGGLHPLLRVLGFCLYWLLSAPRWLACLIFFTMVCCTACVGVSLLLARQLRLLCCGRTYLQAMQQQRVQWQLRHGVEQQAWQAAPAADLKALLLPFLLLAVLLMVDPPDELPDVDVATERSRPMLPWRVVRYGFLLITTVAVFAVVSALATLHAPPRLEALASRLTGGSRAAEVLAVCSSHLPLVRSPAMTVAAILVIFLHYRAIVWFHYWHAHAFPGLAVSKLSAELAQQEGPVMRMVFWLMATPRGQGLYWVLFLYGGAAVLTGYLFRTVRAWLGATPTLFIAALRAAPGDSSAPSGARLLFSDSDRQGTFEFGGRRWPVTVLSLPSVVESYKSLDDTNLVKTTDIGQVLVVGGDQDGSEAVGEAATGETRDGVTPVMRNARERIFRRPIDVPPHVVQKVEYDLLTILAGGAPEGLKFVDTEEEWVVDAATGQGAWLPVKRPARAAQNVALRTPLARHAAAAAARRQRRAVRVAAAAGAEQLLQQPALLLAGFYIEELATVRQLLDQVDREEQAQAILSLLADVELSACPAVATPANLAAPLGQVLADALKLWRQALPAASSSTGAPSGDGAAEAAAARAAPDVPFVEELPPLEEVLPAEVWQPQRPAQRQRQQQQQAGGGVAEVLQAEFSEAGPLDIIDAIATSAEPRVFGRGRRGGAAGGPAGADDDDGDDDDAALAEARMAMGLDAEEARRLVDGAAAKAAEAAGVRFEGGGNGASGGGGAAAPPARNPASRRGPSSGSRKPWEAPAAAQAAQPAAGATGRAGAGAAQAASQAPAAPTKGFGGSSGARSSKGKAGKKGSRLARDAGVAGGAAAAAAAGGQEGAPAAQPPQAAAAEAPAAAAVAAAEAEAPAAAAAEEPPVGEPAAAVPPPEPRPIPGPEAFVLSREQLKGVAERHGLDFGELLSGLQQRGITLSD
ncbi:S-acyltransferase 11 isoform B [Micractinium conductrix]|uniref:S-acyltransferase 11 isoform B n=1 Tax=Micractinium conductrix TaxID=554055 RepID=A0A2P6VIX9_9CHLO|nr:S-acyltransferase 11 isoform B [Micractinium conductrix]|eukprot:PSC74032.1 S-acyltransferase 11 isoform B [Micractinium conductrix]